jgi:hypothetical protein
MAAQRGDESTISVKRAARVVVLLAHRHALAELGGLGRGALAAGTAAEFSDLCLGEIAVDRHESPPFSLAISA